MFPVFYSDCSTHWCHVVIHPSTKSLRKAVRTVQKQDILACCINHHSPEDSLLSTIHLSREDFVAEYVIHEALHAAWHRAELLGIKCVEDFQEFVAYGTAQLVAEITARLTTDQS